MEFHEFPSPCYVVDEAALIRNLEVLRGVERRTGCRVLLAQKGFSMFALYPLIGQYLSGVASSSLFEARLGREEMGKEVHIYAPAYVESEFGDIARLCDHIVFNSFDQLGRFRARAKAAGAECGIRINPEYSEIGTDLYNPCFPHSRLGVTLENFRPDELDGLDGLHFHTMCEQGADTLSRTVRVVEEKFGPYIRGRKWLNFGGGHHITRPDYDVELLVRTVDRVQSEYGVQVYLEPGEAVALNTGYLVSTVLDIVENGMPIAILDASAECHMPDVLAMPYRPPLLDAGLPGERAYTYRLGGPTCLAGDVIGDYSFDRPLSPGDRLVFGDMAHYTMVKNNTFNGICLPAIAVRHADGTPEVIRRFGYEDFRGRLS